MLSAPWSELATVVRRGTGEEPSITMQGPLKAITARLALETIPERKRLLVSLPDRHAAPFSYEGERLENLIALYKSTV